MRALGVLLAFLLALAGPALAQPSKQITQFPLRGTVAGSDNILLQEGGVGAPYGYAPLSGLSTLFLPLIGGTSTNMILNTPTLTSPTITTGTISTTGPLALNTSGLTLSGTSILGGGLTTPNTTWLTGVCAIGNCASGSTEDTQLLSQGSTTSPTDPQWQSITGLYVNTGGANANAQDVTQYVGMVQGPNGGNAWGQNIQVKRNGECCNDGSQVGTGVNGPAPAGVTASIAGNVLHVTALAYGVVQTGLWVQNNGGAASVAANTQITGQQATQGGDLSTWTLSDTQTVASEPMVLSGVNPANATFDTELDFSNYDTDGSPANGPFTAGIFLNAMSAYAGTAALWGAGTTNQATVTATQSGSTLTVSAISGSIVPGAYVYGAGVPTGTKVIAFGTGNGSNAGTYILSTSQTISSGESMTIAVPSWHYGIAFNGTNEIGDIAFLDSSNAAYSFQSWGGQHGTGFYANGTYSGSVFQSNPTGSTANAAFEADGTYAGETFNLTDTAATAINISGSHNVGISYTGDAGTYALAAAAGKLICMDALNSCVSWQTGGWTFTDASSATLATLGDSGLTVNNGITYTLGQKLTTTHGTNATSGVVALSSGAAVVSTTAVAALASAGGAGDAIALSYQSCSNCGTLYVGTVTAGTSFQIKSSNASDASNVYWRVDHIK